MAVDSYIETYREYKRIEEELMTLRGIIEPYLQETGERALASSDGQGRVELVDSERPIMNARYTTYDAEEIKAIVPQNLRRKCFVRVVDKDKLEALCRLGQLPEELLQHKITRKSTSFVARLQK